MRKLPDVIDVFVDGSVVVHMKAPGKLDERRVRKLLEQCDVKVTGCKQDPRWLL